MTVEARKNLSWLVALAIVVLGVLLRLPGMIGWWVNPDEGTYFSLVTWNEWGQFWKEVAAHAHPPLYYVLLRLVGFLTHEFFWLRSVALVSGSIAIWLAWLVGRELGGKETVGAVAGLVSAFAMAFSPGAIVISQIMRPYALQLVLLLVALLALLRYRSDNRVRYLVYYSLGLSLALLTHYSSMFILATFGTLIGFDLISGKLQRSQMVRAVLAHVAPVLILVGLYFSHLRPHLLDSNLATDALRGWLQPMMIHSVADVWLNLLGFFGYLAGPWFAGPALLMFLVGVGIAVRRRVWSIAILSGVAIGISVFAAAVGKYPFGSCRQSSWLIGILIFPGTWALALMLTTSRKIGAAVVVALVALGGVGPQVGQLMGAANTDLEPVTEQVLRTADLEAVSEVFDSLSEPGIVLLSHQSYYLLVPLVDSERETVTRYPESRFFRFQWNARDVIVSEEWAFAIDPDGLDRSDHLYNVVRAVDQELPELRLSEQRDVLMFFGGWLHNMSLKVESANRQLPPNQPLARSLVKVPGFRAYEIDLATFQAAFSRFANSEASRPSP